MQWGKKQPAQNPNMVPCFMLASSLAGTHTYSFLDPHAQLLTLKKCYVEIPKVSFLEAWISQIMLWLPLKFLVLYKFDAALNPVEYCVCMSWDQIWQNSFSLHWMFLSWTFKSSIWDERIVPWYFMGIRCMLASSETMEKPKPTTLFLFHGVALVLILQSFYWVLAWIF